MQKTDLTPVMNTKESLSLLLIVVIKCYSVNYVTLNAKLTLLKCLCHGNLTLTKTKKTHKHDIEGVIISQAKYHDPVIQSFDT